MAGISTFTLHTSPKFQTKKMPLATLVKHIGVTVQDHVRDVKIYHAHGKENEFDSEILQSMICIVRTVESHRLER